MNQKERILRKFEVQGMLKKGAIHYLQPTQGEFLNNIYLQFQKRKGKSIDREFETIEQFHNLPTFQNGSSTCHKGSSPESQFKRCVFWHTSAQECKGERKVSLGREFVRIPMFVLSSRISSSSFYETTKNPKGLLRQIDIRIIIFLDDMFLLSQKSSVIIQVRETLVLLLQNISFVIN